MQPRLFSKGSLQAWLEGRVSLARMRIATYNYKGVRTSSNREKVDSVLIEREKVCPIGHRYETWNNLMLKKPLPDGLHVSIPITGKREIFEKQLPDVDLPPLPGRLENGAIEVFLAGTTPGELQASLDAWIQLLNRYLERANQLIAQHNTELVEVLRETLRQRHAMFASQGAGGVAGSH